MTSQGSPRFDIDTDIQQQDSLNSLFNDGDFTLHLQVFVTGNVPLLTLCTQRRLYAAGSSANRTSSAHCLELSTVPKQWHRKIRA